MHWNREGIQSGADPARTPSLPIAWHLRRCRESHRFCNVRAGQREGKWQREGVSSQTYWIFTSFIMIFFCVPLLPLSLSLQVQFRSGMQRLGVFCFPPEVILHQLRCTQEVTWGYQQEKSPLPLNLNLSRCSGDQLDFEAYAMLWRSLQCHLHTASQSKVLWVDSKT